MVVRDLAASDDIAAVMAGIGRAARAAAAQLGLASSEHKDEALRAGAHALRERRAELLAANAKDLAAAEASGLASAMLDRLALDEGRVEAMAAGLEEIAGLEDPVGQVSAEWTRPNGLSISRVRTPLGVVGVIYESRPNVTVDAAGCA